MSRQDPMEAYVQGVINAQRMLYAYILSLTGDLSTTDDVLQETNLVLWRKRDQFEAGTNFRAWSYRIAHLQVLAYRKKARGDRLRFDDDLIHQLAGEAVERAEQYDPKRRALAECLSKLTERDRQLIQHRYESDEPTEKLAAEIGRSANAIYQALYRIRAALLGCIEKNLATETDT